MNTLEKIICTVAGCGTEADTFGPDLGLPPEPVRFTALGMHPVCNEHIDLLWDRYIRAVIAAVLLNRITGPQVLEAVELINSRGTARSKSTAA